SWMGSGQPDFVRHLQILSNGKLRIFPFRPSELRVHMADYYLSCLGEKRSRGIFPAVPLRSDAVAWSHQFWRQSGLKEKRVLVLAPGSGAKEKNWPIRFYQAVTEWWQRWIGGKVIVVLGPVEEERKEIGNLWSRVLVVRGLELAKVVALLTRCDCYLGNDSGITHLAAALGVETIAFFGPTDPAQWVPRGKRVTVVTQNVECSPCIDSAMKVCPHRKCLTALSPGGVIGMLKGVLERSPGVGEVSEASLTRWEAGIRVEVKNGWK
ncbi:MAG: glycosyltransferase family 9 protein, partial [Candidatus Binatia bacterium]